MTESHAVTPGTEPIRPPRYAIVLPESVGMKSISAGKALVARLNSLGAEAKLTVGNAVGSADVRILLGETGEDRYEEIVRDLTAGRYRLENDGSTVIVGGKTEDDVAFGAKVLIQAHLNGSIADLTVPFSETGETVYTETPDVNTVSTSRKSGPLVLSAWYADHMILQAGKSFTVSGTAVPGTPVDVCLETENGTTVFKETGKVLKSGYFEVELPPVRGGYDPYFLTVTNDGEEIVLKDVLFGEVWLASGQSNMEYKLRHAMEKDGSYALDVLEEDEYLRGMAFYPDNGSWYVGDSRAIGSISAVAYYFARELRARLDLPVAVVDATYGGTDLYAWLDAADLSFHRTAMDYATSISVTIGNIYSERIAPLNGMTIRGLIWYQGENNRYNTPGTYREGFEALRDSFAYLFGFASGADMPVVLSHIAPYGYDDPTSTMLGVFAQEINAIAHAHPETTGSVTIYDEPLDYESKNPNYSCNTLHPSIKEGIGLKMGKAALTLAYGEKGETTAPSFRSAEVKDNSFYVSFDHVGDTLTAGRNDRIYGFTVCGPDRVYFPAEVEIVAPDTVKVTCPSISEPKAIRYAYTNMNTDADLCSSVNGEPFLAAVPFSIGETDADVPFSPQQWMYCEDETLWHTFGNDGGYYPTWEAEGASLTFSPSAYRGSGALLISFKGTDSFSVGPCLSFGNYRSSDLKRGYLSFSGLLVRTKGEALPSALVVIGEENELRLVPETEESEGGWTVSRFTFADAGVDKSELTAVLRKVMGMRFLFEELPESGSVWLDEVEVYR